MLCYTNDDPITARRLKDAGATAVMPAASPIGSGLGLANKNNLHLILDDLKRGDPDYPVISRCRDWYGQRRHNGHGNGLRRGAAKLGRSVSQRPDWHGKSYEFGGKKWPNRGEKRQNPKSEVRIGQQPGCRGNFEKKP